MSYQVLARKWRPRKFDEMAGQEHVLQALINALDNNRLHHAYLFTGTRGVGKTTIARILAKCLNCEQGVSAAPCGECSACRGIAEGRFVDLIEVDAASRTKVEDTRELLENVQYAPTVGRYKVYLIDEVHMLSSHSFNALLKTLEEPPPHVKFLLATTDPQKLPVTVLSRCLQFNLKNLSPERIVDHLSHVLESENIPFEQEALWSLARAAEGSMRDALSLADQAIAHGGGKLTDAEICEMLGTIDLSAVIAIAEALSARDGEAALQQVEKMAEHAPDFSAALAELISIWHRVALAQVVPDALDNRHGDHKAVMALASTLSPEDVQLFYQVALLARRDLPLAPDPQAGFEMALLRMLAFQPEPQTSVDQPVTRAVATAMPQEAVDAAKKSETSVTAVAEPVASQQVQTLEEERFEEDRFEEQRLDDEGFAEQRLEAESQKEKRQEEQRQDEKREESHAPSDLPAENNESSIAESGSSRAETAASPVEPARQWSASVGHIPEPEPEPETRLQTAAISDEAPAGQQAEASQVLSLDNLTPANWVVLYHQLPIGGVLQNTAANLVLLEKQGQCLNFALDVENSSLFEKSHGDRLADVLSDFFQQQVSVTVEVRQLEKDQETPQANTLRLRAEKQARAVEAMKVDERVQQMVARFDGQLLEQTVRPVE